jgi:hypothetical protein
VFLLLAALVVVVFLVALVEVVFGGALVEVVGLAAWWWSLILKSSRIWPPLGDSWI